MKRMLSLVLLAVLAVFASACGEESVTCGPGLEKEGGKCVSICDSGEVFDGTNCVPFCSAGTTFDAATGKCTADISGCAAGTSLNPDTGECIPDITRCPDGTRLNAETGLCNSICADGQYWNGTECADVTTCATGTQFNPDTGMCELIDTACAAGTHLENGVCVADVECGPDTHVENGECVANHLPTPDILDNEAQVPTVTLPNVGDEPVSMGGTIATPSDLNDDGNPDADFDYYYFTTETGGIYLRIYATSEGATLPAFTLYGIETETFPLDQSQWEIFYNRFGLDPNSLDVTREVYLPKAGTYLIEISDYNNVINQLTQAGGFPLGGDDFTYYLTVERLADPTPVAIDITNPTSQLGDFNDGGLAFFSIPSLIIDDIVKLLSAGTPIQDKVSNVVPALMMFDPAGGFMKEELTENIGEDVNALFLAKVAGEYLVVQDFLAVLGPNREFKLDASLLLSESMDGQSSPQDIELPAGEEDLLSFTFLSGEAMVAGCYPPNMDNMFRMTIFDSDMNILSVTESQFDDWTGEVYPAGGFAYSEFDGKFFIQVQALAGQTATYTLKWVQFATPELAEGETLGVPVQLFPEFTYYDAGVAHYVANEGDLLVFSDLTTHNPPKNWVAPIAYALTPKMETVGPAYDVANETNTEPGIAYTPWTGHFLYWVFDPDGAIANGSYDITKNTLATGDMGMIDDTHDGLMTNQALEAATGLAAFSFVADQGTLLSITVTPASGGTMKPEVWMLQFGELVCFWWCEWSTDPEAMQLGLIAQVAAASDGQAATVKYVSPYAGKTIILVKNAGANGSTDLFDVSAEVQPAPCLSAIAITVDGSGHADVTGNTLDGLNIIDDPSNCTGWNASGPELYYSIDLLDGEAITVSVEPTDYFDASIYMFTDCADPNGTCVAGSDGGNPEAFTYTVPAGAAGKYIIGVDAYGAGEGGEFNMTVDVQ